MDHSIEKGNCFSILGRLGNFQIIELLAILGDQFDVGDEICGAVISIRQNEDILSLWNKTANDGRTNLKIRCE
jgi:hypothetical protein